MYKRQAEGGVPAELQRQSGGSDRAGGRHFRTDLDGGHGGCLLYTSDAADDLLCVDLGGRRIIKKKKMSPDIIGCQVSDTYIQY